ncbi:hypothetical protein HOLleu_41495 [Holothuria leucospilota]|uniref:BRCT domain-containing protein n=1 Tax=Holothuria leucospilota TaxID=206669 RepID=A0A9Q1BCN9_HOLLE|nr:hypothetical protein HOLleu_41495 [Holothuria leucospilota]
MDFSVGQKVQAKDELGRWENGHIKDITSEGQLIVGFDGWAEEFNVEVPCSEVRQPVHPFEAELGAIGRKRVKGANRHALSILRNLEQGDKVSFRGKSGEASSGEVTEVDPFKKSVIVSADGEEFDVPAALLLQKTHDRGECSCLVVPAYLMLHCVVDGDNVHFGSVKIPIIEKDGKIYVKCPNMLDIIGLRKHVDKEGYRYVDNNLKKLGFTEDCFIRKGQRRHFILLDAACALTEKVRGARWCVRPRTIVQEVRDVCSGHQELKKGGLLNVSGTCDVNTEKGRKHIAHEMKAQMKSIYEGIFNKDLDVMLKCFSSIVKPHKKLRKEFDGHFSKQEVEVILKHVPCTKEGKKFVQMKSLYDEISQAGLLGVEELIHIQENFNGCRLTEHLQKRLPGIFPSRSAEVAMKKIYTKGLRAVLLPRRTVSGWRIDPQRLLEVLCFRYPWLCTHLLIKVYGDGREVGGRASTYVSISLLNNELALNGHSYQSPKEIFPVAIFYEKDDRDNLEENLEYRHSNWLNTFLQCNRRDGNHVFLTGDEMFLEHILDGVGDLSPSSLEGWNLYAKTHKDQKTSTNAGFRTNLPVRIDRAHPENILSAVPLRNVVPCLLHALAISVEKLLTLVITDVISNMQANLGTDSALYREEKITNLENNINERGVKQGCFAVHFDTRGNVKPIKLNKDDALAIIATANQGPFSSDILHNVLSRSSIPNSIPKHVNDFLKLPATFTEYDLVSHIWNSFYNMIIILKVDREPTLINPELLGSLDPNDYHWGYTEEDKVNFKFYSELFYQTFRLKYTASELTPYMVKLIDYGYHFMNTLPCSIGRFQAEGGEHLNYIHNNFYYQHTTRHGGKFGKDPVLATFSHMWRSLCYEITYGCVSKEYEDARNQFVIYRQRHVAATLIQAHVRGYIVRVKLKQKRLHCDKPKDTGKVPLSFSHITFVLCGSIPKLNKKSYTQEMLTELIKIHKGRVRRKLPVKSCLSPKLYAVLYNKNAVKGSKLPISLFDAYKNGYKILDYSYVLDCIQANELLSQKGYEILLPLLPKGMTKKKECLCKTFWKEI